MSMIIITVDQFGKAHCIYNSTVISSKKNLLLK